MNSFCVVFFFCFFIVLRAKLLSAHTRNTAMKEVPRRDVKMLKSKPQREKKYCVSIEWVKSSERKKKVVKIKSPPPINLNKIVEHKCSVSVTFSGRQYERIKSKAVAMTLKIVCRISCRNLVYFSLGFGIDVFFSTYEIGFFFRFRKKKK